MNDLLRLLVLFRAERKWLLAGTALSAAVILSNVALLALAGWFITAMALAGLGIITINYFLPAAGIRALAILRAFGRYGERLVTHEATLRVLARLRVWFYEHLEPLAPARLQFYRGGDLLSRIRADIDTLDNFYLRVLVPSIAAAVAVVVMTVFMALFSVAVACVLVAGLLLAGVALPLLAQRLGRAPGAQAVQRRADLRSAVADGVRGLGELKVFQANARQSARVDCLSEELLASQRRQASIDGLSNALSGLINRVTLWLAIVLTVPLVATGVLEGPQLAMIAFFVLAAFESVAALPWAFQALGETRAAARRVFEVVDAEPAVDDPVEESPEPATYALRFKSVSMRYATAADWVLNGIDLDICAGQRVAIVGPTGAGKTSLFNLLLRFWPYQHGAVEIGGQPLDGFRGETVRRWCAVISQQTHLFDTTVRDNLLIARPEADEAQLTAALTRAQVHDEIMALPKGLGTQIGETGARLSGGQARRVAIARAFLKDARILLLDEPTEGLDANAERAVLDALDNLMSGRTTLIVTHRPQALYYADEVIVVNAGQIVERGAPDELLLTGRYLPLYAGFG